jgi:mannose-6-phosphate isomerase-like protein (cupin superfamily)
VIEELPAPSSIVELSRGQVRTGASWDVVAPGPALYGVEAGALGIRVDGPAILTRAATDTMPGGQEAAAPGVDFTLRPGDQMMVLAGTPHLLRNDGEDPAVFLSVVVFPAASAIPSWLPAGEQPPGVDVQPLAADVVTAITPPSSATIEVVAARTTVAPGMDVSMSPASFELLVVESGTLVLTSDYDQDHASTYGAGEVIRLQPGTEVRARNESTTPLVLVSVRIDAGGGDDDAEPLATPST